MHKQNKFIIFAVPKHNLLFNMANQQITSDVQSGIVQHYEGKGLDFINTLGDDLKITEYYLDGHDVKNTYPTYFKTDRYVLEFIEQGEIDAQINLQKVHFKAPCLVLLLPEFVLHLENATQDSRAVIISFTQNYIDKIFLPQPLYQLRHSIQRNPIYNLTEAQIQTAHSYFDLMHQVMLEYDIAQSQEDTQTKKFGDSALLSLTHSCICYLHGLISTRMRAEQQQSRSEELTNEFMLLAERDCVKNRSLDYYADLLHISPKYLANVVKQTSGRTAGEWLTDYTLIQAKMLLTTTLMNIQQISVALGFQNQSHFGTWFRRQTGVGPREYKRKIK